MPPDSNLAENLQYAQERSGERRKTERSSDEAQGLTAVASEADVKHKRHKRGWRKDQSVRIIAATFGPIAQLVRAVDS